MNTATRYSPEVRGRAVRPFEEHRGQYDSEWAAITSISWQIRCPADTIRKWVRRSERDRGLRSRHHCRSRAAPGTGAGEPGAEAGRRDRAQAVGFPRPAGARSQRALMVSFIDAHPG